MIGGVTRSRSVRYRSLRGGVISAKLSSMGERVEGIQKRTIGRECGSQLGQIEGRQDSGHVCIMAEVKIQRLVRREGGFVVVKSQIGLGTPCGKHVILYARKKFLHITNTDCFASRRPKVVVSSEG